MQVRLECYEHEVNELVFRLRQILDVYEVSKFYPLTRQTAIQTVTEGRVYVKIKDFNKSAGNFRQDFVEFLVKDMLRYLDTLHKVFGYDVSKETDNLRAFYLSSTKLDTQQQMLDLINEWKIALLGRVNK